ncbi:hypothetical protein ABH939_006385 [Rhodococcus sp. 27YEA6]|jgi:hypothetical protein
MSFELTTSFEPARGIDIARPWLLPSPFRPDSFVRWPRSVVDVWSSTSKTEAFPWPASYSLPVGVRDENR